ncbi:MAG: nuclear transport factor 2 family protein [Dehalococcoidia bacterium]|nr:nuclear transport factor 2 family protein [Dehalococcoidia bacterium]
MVQPLPPGPARGEAYFRAFLARAEAERDLFTAYVGGMEPDCRIYAENGELHHPQHMWEMAQTSHALFPDLTAEVERARFVEDRVIMQLTFTGTSSADPALEGVYGVVGGLPVLTRCAVVAVPNERLRLTEVWNYLNVAFSITFPGGGIHETPPPEDGAGIQEARALYRSWADRVHAGDDFVSAVVASFAPGAVVHLGNGDDVRAPKMLHLFEVLAASMPDLTMEVETVLPSDDGLVVQFTMSGTHTGTLGPYEASGREMPSRGMVIARPDRLGRTAELWLYVAPMMAVAMPPEG